MTLGQRSSLNLLALQRNKHHGTIRMEELLLVVRTKGQLVEIERLHASV